MPAWSPLSSLVRTAPGTPSRISYVQPYPSAWVLVSVRILSRTISRSEAVLVLIERRRVAVCAMTLPAFPERKAPTVTTALL